MTAYGNWRWQESIRKLKPQSLSWPLAQWANWDESNTKPDSLHPSAELSMDAMPKYLAAFFQDNTKADILHLSFLIYE